jgi:hypothetical protein
MCKNGLGECPSGDFIHVEASPGQGHEKASPRHIFTWFINWQRGKRNYVQWPREFRHIYKFGRLKSSSIS